MGSFFDRPDPQQAVPADLNNFRQRAIAGGENLLPLLFGFGQGNNINKLPLSDLQRFGNTGIMQFLRQPAPEMRALELSLPALMEQLSGTPGGDVLDPLQTRFDQNLEDQLQALTASAPGRFSSAAIHTAGQTRQRSLNDFNLLAAQVMEQGRARQLNAAQTLGMLSSAAGQQPFQRLGQATELGQRQTDQATQNRQFGQGQQMQALQFLLGMLGGPAFGGPFTQDASGFENFLGLLNTASNFIPFAGGGGGANIFPGSGGT